MLWKSKELYCTPRLSRNTAQDALQMNKLLGQTARSSILLSLCSPLFFFNTLKGETTWLY